MKNLSTLFGDGEGNYSMMRVVMFLVVVALLAAKFYNAHLTSQPVTFTTQDLAILGTLVGGKVIQSAQENSAPQPKESSTADKTGLTQIEKAL